MVAFGENSDEFVYAMDTTADSPTDKSVATAVGVFFCRLADADTIEAVVAMMQHVNPDTRTFSLAVDVIEKVIEQQGGQMSVADLRSTARVATRVYELTGVARDERSSDVSALGVAVNAFTSVKTKPLPPTAALEKFLDASVKPPARLAAPVEFAVEETKGEIRALLSMLPHRNLLPHVQEKIGHAYPTVTKKTTHLGRGNAVLYLLSRYGGTRELSLTDLVFGLRRMTFFEEDVSADEAARTTAWEVNNLVRNGWPIRKLPLRKYQFVLAQETPM